MLTHPVDAIIDNSRTDFDLYIELGDRLTLYAKSPYVWTRDELGRLLSAGHKVLFYSTLDRDKVEAYQKIHQSVHIDRTSEPRQRIVNLTDAAAELTRVLYSHPLTASAVEKANEIGQAMVLCIAEDSSCVTALGKLARHDDYTFYHSARVAAYALAVAMQLSQRDQRALQEMATGCLLHDVGKSRIELGILNKRGVLTKEEWGLMRRHPEFGDEIVSQSLLSAVPRSIILHHHERFDGSGYPHNLTERELLEETKIAAFADIFDALTTNRPYQVSRTPFEALDFIRHKLASHVHKDSFQAMVELLKHDKMPLPKPLDGGMPPSQEPLPVSAKADDTTDDEG
jgi:HD-GYP domain-containing protein (c-di-GMP phosphodiesterase class II)